MSNTTIPDPSLTPHLAEIDKYMQQPLKTSTEREAEEAVNRQRHEKLIADFNASEEGKKLHQYRFDKFVVPAMQRFMHEMQTMTPWACEIAGLITETTHATDPEYMAWDQYYDQYLEQYIKRHGG